MEAEEYFLHSFCLYVTCHFEMLFNFMVQTPVVIFIKCCYHLHFNSEEGTEMGSSFRRC